MPAQNPAPAACVSANVVEIEHALSRMTYLAGRARQHERLMATAGLDLDRAAVAILRNIAASDPVRPGVLAVRLSVEASHVTRQLRQLERGGYVVRVADPEDRRAQRVQLTDAGMAAVERIRETSRRGVELALADWTPDELEQLAVLFRRLVHDFVAHTETPLYLSAPASGASPT
ncbi:MarR family winged helix-turn-helix transcriptional regulator [Streptomyces sp. NPDC019531]|uniref:MarR family winged helix-turn-helix transcriptional regulator n=1 Tax=Streptomyces sp. NPDC019531 TaxID=3365062 RepID=UPI00384AC62E